MPKWEYTTINAAVSDENDVNRTLKRMDKLGEEGWELVSSNMLKKKNFNLHYFFFKRQK